MLRFRSPASSLLCRLPNRARFAAALSGLATLWCLLDPLPVRPQSAGQAGRVVNQGIAVQWQVEPASGADALREGEEAIFRLTITDTATGSPVRGANPGAWLDVQRPGGDADCARKVASLSGTSMLKRPAVDLNNFFVLALNGDATINVVDPRFQFGGSKLLALVALKSPGADWVLTADQSRLFVSLPDANEVAVVETVSWKVITSLPVGPQPARLAIQPDGRALWVTYGGAAADSGVAVFNLADLKLAARIPTGRGPHPLAFSDDSRFAFVGNQANGQASEQATGSVTLIETSTLAKVKEIAAGRKPVSLTFSKTAQAAYVADETDGSVMVIDPLRRKVVARVQLDPGLQQIKFAPGDRYGLVVNAARNLLQVLDASTNRIVQTAAMKQEPDQISFSDKLAYIRHRRSEQVLMIPLDQLGGAELSPAEFPGGQRPFGQTARASLAATIIPAPGSGAMLVANPADQAIYYYQEGMAAPMGTFGNYKREPRAALVVDRTLRELAPGVYQTSAQLPAAGPHELIFFLNAPRIVHCAPVAIVPNPALAAQAKKQPPLVQPLITERSLRVGATTRLRFQLSDAVTKQPHSGLTDVRVLTFLAPGTQQQRHRATPAGAGIYEIDFTPPEAGVYYLYVEAPSQGLSFNHAHHLILEARTEQ